MDILNIINTAGNLTAIILGLLAIVLSIWFFVLAKNSELETKRALEGIRTQTDALQKLAGRWLDRFTKHLVEEKPLDALWDVASQVSNLPERISQYLQINIAQVHQNRSEIISCYIALQYYAAQANVFAQTSLPSFNELNETNESHRFMRQTVDQSSADVKYLETLIGAIDSTELSQNPLVHLRRSYVDFWSNHVKDSLQFYAQSNREAQA